MVINSALLSLIIVLISVTIMLGIIVLFTNKGWKKANNVNFSIFAFAVVLMQVSSLLNLICVDYTLVLFFGRLSYAAGALVVYALVHFALVFPRPVFKDFNIRVLNYGALFITIITIFISFTDEFIRKITFEKSILIFDYGSQLYPYLIGICLNIIVVVVAIILGYMYNDYHTRQKVKWLFIGLVLTAAIIVFTDVLAPAIFGSTMEYLSNFGFAASVIVVAASAYAIVKHELFDIRVILTETAVAIVVIASFVQTLAAEKTTDKLISIVIMAIVIYGGYLLIKSVIGEIKRREQLQTLSTQLAQANNHLKELDAMKTEFVSLASHELLTPVSAIEGYLSMLLDEKMAKVEDPKAVKYLDNVYKSAKRLARLVADMLNISRIEEGRLLVEKKEVSLSDLISQVIAEIKFKAEERQQTITFKPDGWKTFVDPDKIKEVIVNIIGNAIKYSKGPGNIVVRVRHVPTVWVSERWQKIEEAIKNRPLDDQEAIKSAVDSHFRDFVGTQQLMISIEDDGIGIPKEELPRLFKKFHRVGNFSTQESQGTGLGLYISRALVELHHGRIWADSEGEGKGSTFTFTLPDLNAKKELSAMEALAPVKKEQLKPLAHPAKVAEEL